MNGRADDELTDEDRLDDILQYADDAIETLGDATYADFLNDRNLRFAVYYLVAVVGEAASKMSPDTRRQYPLAPWRRFRNLRNNLIHGYYSVAPDEIHEVVLNELPALIAALTTPAGQQPGAPPR